MKSLSLNSICAASILAALAMPVRPSAQSQAGAPAQGPTAPHYAVTDLGTLQGGTFSQPFFINKSGMVAGSSTNSAGSQNAVLWFKGNMTDIGTPGLGGTNSIAFAVNEGGAAAGEAENSISDPNGEDFCGFGTHVICLPFVWENNVMTPLPTLGGSNGAANLVNNLGQIAGTAENATTDPECPAPQVLHFKPVYWENGKIHELPTHRGDPDGIAFAVNDHGQIVGGSGTCTTFNPNFLDSLLSRHALLWQKGRLTDLGSLGGKTGKAGGNLAVDLNNRGEVVGFSDLAGDTTFHAFRWTQVTGMLDLGTVQGDVASSAISINERSVVVGLSIAANGNTRAVVWHKGVPSDLNTLVEGNSPLYLLTGCSINSRGEITGLGATSTGEIHTYLAVPVHHDESSAEGRNDRE